MTTITDEHRKAAREWLYQFCGNIVFEHEHEALAHLLATREEMVRASKWEPISSVPDCDDLMWFARGNTFEGPRIHYFDDADYWDYWCYAEPPSLPAPPEPTTTDAGRGGVMTFYKGCHEHHAGHEHTVKRILKMAMRKPRHGGQRKAYRNRLIEMRRQAIARKP